MNPFGGFMQAVTGVVPGFGDNTGNIGKGFHGLPFVDDTVLPAGENTRSFLAWVQNFMDNVAGADAAGENSFNFQPKDLDPDLPALDQLQALMADVKEQFSQDQPAASSLNGGSGDNGRVPLPRGIINAIIARHQRRHVADLPSLEVLPENPELMAAKLDTPADGKAHAAGNDLRFQAAVSGVPVQVENADAGPVKDSTPAVGQTVNAAGKGLQFQTAAAGVSVQTDKTDDRQVKDDTSSVVQSTKFARKGPQLQTAVSGVPTQAASVDDSKIKAPLLEPVMKESRPEEGVEKGDARSLFKPAVPAGGEGQATTNRLIQERLPSGPGIVEKGNDSARTHLQAEPGQSKDPQSMLTGLTGQGSAQPDDDTTDFRGRDPHQQAQRIEPADVKEEAWQKDRSSDVAKNAVAEQTKPHSSFQDTARAVAGDQPTNITVKPAAGQAAALTRTEDAAVKTFQTTVMDQIVDRAAMRSIHGRSEIQIRLKPEFLGNVQMNVAADKEQLVVRIMTDRPVVKEIIETHLHHLKTELQNQGLTIDKFEVMVNPDGNQQPSREQFAGMFKHHFSQNGRRQQHGQDPETLNRDGGNTPDDGRPTRDGVNYFA